MMRAVVKFTRRRIRETEVLRINVLRHRHSGEFSSEESIMIVATFEVFLAAQWAWRRLNRPRPVDQVVDIFSPVPDRAVPIVPLPNLQSSSSSSSDSIDIPWGLRPSF